MKRHIACICLLAFMLRPVLAQTDIGGCGYFLYTEYWFNAVSQNPPTNSTFCYTVDTPACTWCLGGGSENTWCNPIGSYLTVTQQWCGGSYNPNGPISGRYSGGYAYGNPGSKTCFTEATALLVASLPSCFYRRHTTSCTMTNKDGRQLKNKLIRLFAIVAAFVFIVTGTAKIWSALGDAKVLSINDPILNIKFGRLLLAVGALEIAIAAFCLISDKRVLQLSLLAWLASLFAVYRVGLSWMGWRGVCPCLGNLTDALHISPRVADNFMKAMLAFLLIGSYGLLLSHWKLLSRCQLDGGLGGQDSLQRQLALPKSE